MVKATKKTEPRHLHAQAGSFWNLNPHRVRILGLAPLLSFALPSPVFPSPQHPWARSREMIKTSKAVPHCRSKLRADGREPDPASTSAASPQPEICHSQQLSCSTPLVSLCQSQTPRGSTCSQGWVRAVQSTPSAERQVLYWWNPWRVCM